MADLNKSNIMVSDYMKIDNDTKNKIVNNISKKLNLPKNKIEKAFKTFLSYFWIELDNYRSGGLDIRLFQNLLYGNDDKPIFEIFCDGHTVMTNYTTISESILAIIATKSTKSAHNRSLLIAGLGMGFTLTQLLKLENVENVDVVEKDIHIVNWNKKYFSKINDYCIFDERVKIINEDFKSHINKVTTHQKYDSIIIDIDNGSKGIIFPNNNEIFHLQFIKKLKSFLKDNGSINYWCLYKDKQLVKRLKKTSDNVYEHKVNITIEERSTKATYIYSAHY